jgi:uncharacterized protein YkwD
MEVDEETSTAVVEAQEAAQQHVLLPHNETELTEARLRILNTINQHRGKHASPAVQLNQQMNESAQKWAEYLAVNAEFRNNVELLSEKDYGENLYFYGTSGEVLNLSGKLIYYDSST